MKANDRQIGGRHYQQQEGIPQHWDVAWAWNYDQFEYCISKYVERYEHKNGLQDLEKARHHLDKYLEVQPRDPKLLVGRVSMAVQGRIEVLECNDYQGAVLLYLHTRDLVSASHYLNELIKEVEEHPYESRYVPDKETTTTNEGDATKDYVEQDHF